MFQVSVEETFSAGHALRGYKGKCENPHGHNYRVRVTVEGPQLDAIGLLVDFVHVKQVIALVQWQVPVLLFEGTEAGKIHLQLSRVGRKKAGQERRSLAGKISHHAVQPLAVRRIGRNALESICSGPIGDVLMKTRIGLLLRKQEIPIFLREIHGNPGKEQDLPAFELIAIPAGGFRRRV